jgi:hypothetical protein
VSGGHELAGDGNAEFGTTPFEDALGMVIAYDVEQIVGPDDLAGG